VSHLLFTCDLFSTLSRGLDHISNANPACSCDQFYKFQFHPIHPPSRRLSDVEAAASVHEDLGEPDVADDGVDNERVFPRARHVVEMVTLVEGDGLVGLV
jgi:hypothetical protein